VRRVAIIASASGNGKTTLGRELAQRLGVPFVERDALVHGSDWTETRDEELRAIVEPIVRSDGWVIDGDLGRIVADDRHYSVTDVTGSDASDDDQKPPDYDSSLATPAQGGGPDGVSCRPCWLPSQEGTERSRCTSRSC
jgi:hypothetical protein